MYNTKHELSTSTAKTKYNQLGREPICLPAEIEDKIERNMGHRVLRNILGNGLYIEWYENGKKSRKGIYKDGVEDGLWTHWWENGKQYTEIEYKDGIICRLITKDN